MTDSLMTFCVKSEKREIGMKIFCYKTFKHINHKRQECIEYIRFHKKEKAFKN